MAQLAENDPTASSLTGRLRPVWRDMKTGAHLLLVGPELIVSRRQRRLLAEMRVLCQRLPELLQLSLPEALTQLDGGIADYRNLPGEASIRRLAEMAALLEHRSPLGLCLRRSLIRYHYLRRLGLPMQIVFGARLAEGNSSQPFGGHSWLTLDGRPYYEEEAHWSGFTVMFVWPE